MKNLFRTLFFIAIYCAGCSSDPKENDTAPEEESQIALYDENKEAIAYIDYDDEATLFLYDGEPVAYIESENQVYGFNGKLLGWYSDGVLYDLTCRAVGAKHGIARGGINTVVTHLETIKGVKHVKPVKPVKGDSYPHPALFDNWSETNLKDFFAKGKE